MANESVYPGFLNTLIAVAVTYAVILVLGVSSWALISLKITKVDMTTIMFGGLLVGTVFGLLLVPLATAAWMTLRNWTGEGLIACLTFGTVFGMLVSIIGPSFIVTILMGFGGGLVYWLISRAMARRRQRQQPQEVEKVFE